MNVLCIVTDEFEELEAIGTIDLLRRAGISIDVYAIDSHAAKGQNDITISNLDDLKQADTMQYDALFLPGGSHYQKLEANEQVLHIIDEFFAKQKLVTAICAAPTILGRRGYLKNKQYTCYTSMNDEFGGTYIDQYSVTDGNLITGRSPAAVFEFAFAIIEKIAGKEKVAEIKSSIYY